MSRGKNRLINVFVYVFLYIYQYINFPSKLGVTV